jgi:DNA-binding winged helix-turn-helix (wHTH) protein/Tfp pilus assembly protein PilF/TolB-like protein
MQDSGNNFFEFGKFRLDKINKVLKYDGEIVALPLKAVELLCLLIENRNEIVAKNEILDKVWENSFVDEGVLTQNIHKLRKLFEEHGEKDVIKNVPRRGYIFKFENIKETSLTIERETFEEIQISEESRFTFSKPKNLGKILLISTTLILLFAGITAFIYLRPKNEVKNNSVISISPLNVSGSKLKTVAILPFTISVEKETSFAESLTSDLTTRIGSLNKFNVKPDFIVKNAKNIRADFILSGNITPKNNEFIVQINVRDVRNNADILTKTFETEQTNLVRLEDSISNETVNSILATLSDNEKLELSTHLPTNFAAYEMYQTGFELWRKRQDSSKYFEKAIELDANFAKAYIGLASANMFFPEKKETVAENVEKAAKMEPNSAELNSVSGFVKIFQEHNWTEAEIALKNALATDETNVNAHHWLAMFYATQNRLDEAKTEIKSAIDLDENNPTLYADLGLIHYFAGEKDSAKENCQKALELQPNSEFAQKCLADTDKSMPDNVLALQELEIAEKTNLYNLVFINVEPRFATIRNEPKFKEVLRQINLDAK